MNNIQLKQVIQIRLRRTKDDMNLCVVLNEDTYEHLIQEWNTHIHMVKIEGI